MNKFHKYGLIFLAILCAIACYGYYEINSVGTGYAEPSVPKGYSTVAANGYEFSYFTKGNPNDPVVLFLHGFPECSAMWKKAMNELSSKGYYCVAFDQRGYSAGARPLEIEAYAAQHLTDDVIAVADALGLDKFHLVGHDWGSAIGWKVTADHPGRVESYFALSVPHTTAFTRAYREDESQYETSSYIRDIQTPMIPEYFMARNDYGGLKDLLTERDPEEAESYLNLFRQKNALKGMLNWYRGNIDIFEKGIDLPTIEQPVTLVWGNTDLAIKRYGVNLTKDYVSGYYKFVELDAGHWLIQENYTEVMEELTTFLSSQTLNQKDL